MDWHLSQNYSYLNTSSANLTAYNSSIATGGAVGYVTNSNISITNIIFGGKLSNALIEATLVG